MEKVNQIFNSNFTKFSKANQLKQYVLILLSVFMMSGICYAQDITNSKPASTNVLGIEYPRIFSDLSVVFQVKAPEARKVQIQLDKLYDMQRDTLGIWTVKTTPQVHGFHYYTLIIDGVWVADPSVNLFLA